MFMTWKRLVQKLLSMITEVMGQKQMTLTLIMLHILHKYIKICKGVKRYSSCLATLKVLVHFRKVVTHDMKVYIANI